MLDQLLHQQVQAVPDHSPATEITWLGDAAGRNEKLKLTSLHRQPSVTLELGADLK